MDWMSCGADFFTCKETCQSCGIGGSSNKPDEPVMQVKAVSEQRPTTVGPAPHDDIVLEHDMQQVHRLLYAADRQDALPMYIGGITKARRGALAQRMQLDERMTVLKLVREHVLRFDKMDHNARTAIFLRYRLGLEEQVNHGNLIHDLHAFEQQIKHLSSSRFAYSEGRNSAMNPQSSTLKSGGSQRNSRQSPSPSHHNGDVATLNTVSGQKPFTQSGSFTAL